MCKRFIEKGWKVIVGQWSNCYHSFGHHKMQLISLFVNVFPSKKWKITSLKFFQMLDRCSNPDSHPFTCVEWMLKNEHLQQSSVTASMSGCPSSVSSSTTRTWSEETTTTSIHSWDFHLAYSPNSTLGWRCTLVPWK